MMMTGITSGRAEPRAADEDVDKACALLHRADGPEEVAVDHQPDADHHARHHAGRGTIRRSTRCRWRRRPPP